VNKAILVLAAVVIAVFLAGQTFTERYPLPDGSEFNSSTVSNESNGPDLALGDIYYNVTILGLKEATKETLAEDFKVDTSSFASVNGKYSNGVYGAADVIMVKPRFGMDAQVKEALSDIQAQRTARYKRYDIYDSYRIASQGIIFERGDWIILLMIDDAENAREIIEEYIPR